MNLQHTLHLPSQPTALAILRSQRGVHRNAGQHGHYGSPRSSSPHGGLHDDSNQRSSGTGPVLVAGTVGGTIFSYDALTLMSRGETAARGNGVGDAGKDAKGTSDSSASRCASITCVYQDEPEIAFVESNPSAASPVLISASSSVASLTVSASSSETASDGGEEAAGESSQEEGAKIRGGGITTLVSPSSAGAKRPRAFEDDMDTAGHRPPVARPNASPPGSEEGGGSRTSYAGGSTIDLPYGDAAARGGKSARTRVMPATYVADVAAAIGVWEHGSPAEGPPSGRIVFDGRVGTVFDLTADARGRLYVALQNSSVAAIDWRAWRHDGGVPLKSGEAPSRGAGAADASRAPAGAWVMTIPLGSDTPYSRWLNARDDEKPATGGPGSASGSGPVPGHVGYVYSLCSAGTSVYSGGGDGLILEWDSSPATLAGCALVRSLEGHTGSVRTLASDGASFLYSGSSDETVRVWLLATGSCARKIQIQPPANASAAQVLSAGAGGMNALGMNMMAMMAMNNMPQVNMGAGMGTGMGMGSGMGMGMGSGVPPFTAGQSSGSAAGSPHASPTLGRFRGAQSGVGALGNQAGSPSAEMSSSAWNTGATLLSAPASVLPGPSLAQLGHAPGYAATATRVCSVAVTGTVTDRGEGEGLLIVGTEGGIVLVYDRDNLRPICSHVVHSAPITSIVPGASRGFVTAAEDGTIAVWRSSENAARAASHGTRGSPHQIRQRAGRGGGAQLLQPPRARDEPSSPFSSPPRPSSIRSTAAPSSSVSSSPSFSSHRTPAGADPSTSPHWPPRSRSRGQSKRSRTPPPPQAAPTVPASLRGPIADARDGGDDAADDAAAADPSPDAWPVTRVRERRYSSEPGDYDDLEDPSDLDRYRNLDLMLEALSVLVSIPSVSSDTSQCWRCARAMQSMLVDMLGADSPKLVSRDEGTNPLLVARVGHDPSRPTLVVYGHYDVVPPGVMDSWNSPPFEMTGRDGFIYGRGVTDNKGPVVAAAIAVRELMEESSDGAPPVNIVFLVEGEEERGSAGIREALDMYAQWIGPVDTVLVSNNYWIDDERPCLTYGLRGVVKTQIEISGPSKDLHSGVDGGAVHEPMADLVRVLSDVSTRLAFGEEDGIHAFGAEERARYDALDFNVAEYIRGLGVDRVRDEDATSLLRRRWHDPAVTIHGVEASSGKGHHCTATIPMTARAAVSVRIVPAMDPETTARKVEAFCKASFDALESPNRLSFQVTQSGDWWLGDTLCPAYGVAARAVREVWGPEPLPVREGGSMPVTSILEKRLGAKAIVVPLGLHSDGAHLPNERMRLLNLVNGKDVLKKIVQGLAGVMKSDV